MYAYHILKITLAVLKLNTPGKSNNIAAADALLRCVAMSQSAMFSTVLRKDEISYQQVDGSINKKADILHRDIWKQAIWFIWVCFVTSRIPLKGIKTNIYWYEKIAFIHTIFRSRKHCNTRQWQVSSFVILTNNKQLVGLQ